MYMYIILKKIVIRKKIEEHKSVFFTLIEQVCHKSVIGTIKVTRKR